MSVPLPADPRPADRPPAEVILGYLNFSHGRPDPAVHAAFNALFADLRPETWDEAHRALSSVLDRLSGEKAAFRDAAQARAVLSITFDGLLPAYLTHHADLLFHLNATDLLNPFFAVRLCEAVLAAGGPWDDRERIIADALARLNDYVGHRPLAILENGRKAEVYPHERFRPVPLYIRGAGVAVGRYHDLVAAALAHLAATPRDLLDQASFDPERMDELALDVRAHDALHPAFKRTNYLFGEWDPHLIDSRGYYRRFVARRAVLDALLGWIDAPSDLSPAERLHDASAVLCGTILMASAISGWGPAAHDSTASLASLLPVVARHRDAFYAQLMSRVEGSRAARLAAVVEATRQPFGHVRQQLNIALANYAAAQMQRRAVAEQFARMGFAEAARDEAAKIPALSTRFECELNVRAESAVRSAGGGSVGDAAHRLDEAADLLVRGVECGALIDPWNILGFQAQFPLFIAREDAVPDHRAEWLVGYMERLFAAGGRVLTEAAARGEAGTAERVRQWFDRTAAWWDRYATTTVSDLSSVRGSDLAAGADAVASAIADWRSAGRATGDLAFWRTHVDRLETPKAFADVVEALLGRGDLVAAQGLLIQWLSQADSIGLGDGASSFFDLSLRWMRDLTIGPAAPPAAEQVRVSRRFFDYLEANAGEFWTVPSFADPSLGGDPADDEEAPPAEDDEDNVFGAAYEGMVYRDSTADGVEGDTLDVPASPSGGEFEGRLRDLEPRLRFFDTLARLWRFAAGRVGLRHDAGDFTSAIAQWHGQAQRFAEDLKRLARAIEKRPLGADAGDLDANIEYDAQLQSKNHLLQLAVATAVRMASAERLLRSRIAAAAKDDPTTAVLRPLLAGDKINVRRSLPRLLRSLLGQPLLYVAVENGGDPAKAIAARSNQDLLATLAVELPRLGLLRETRHVLRTAFRMERQSRPGGLAVTEFDRLFRTGFNGVLGTVVAARPSSSMTPRPVRRIVSETRRARSRVVPRKGAFRLARGREGTTVALVGAAVDRYVELWLRHAATMRLSAVEVFNDSATWTEAKRFIRKYGGELFHARVLPLSNLRAILHEGVDKFFDHLIEADDPLKPSPLVAALQAEDGFRRRAARILELIYTSVVDEIERFVEYNSTTTQSDYGERFDSFLDFLRAEAAYRRDEWDLTPLRIAHEVLAASGQDGAARLWEQVVRTRTAEPAKKHLARLAALEKRHAMRLPSISDRLAERFVKPFAVDRMTALLAPAIRDARSGRVESPAFRILRREIDAYLATSTGSAAEMPEWIGKLEAAVTRALGTWADPANEKETVTGRPVPRLRPGQVLRQIMTRRRRR